MVAVLVGSSISPGVNVSITMMILSMGLDLQAKLIKHITDHITIREHQFEALYFGKTSLLNRVWLQYY